MFRQIKGIADFGASMAVGAPLRQARKAAPEGHPAVYATTGMPGTWRLGRCT